MGKQKSIPIQSLLKHHCIRVCHWLINFAGAKGFWQQLCYDKAKHRQAGVWGSQVTDPFCLFWSWPTLFFSMSGEAHECSKRTHDCQVWWKRSWWVRWLLLWWGLRCVQTSSHIPEPAQLTPPDATQNICSVLVPCKTFSVVYSSVILHMYLYYLSSSRQKPSGVHGWFRSDMLQVGKWLHSADRWLPIGHSRRV